ncbi:MAG TPA: MBL fold metallo-hydrolase [Acidimicrobiales bacterium]|jgi:glyoxylase-like metal-dependent hydrolase (beta-lactamase superfamily II)
MTAPIPYVRDIEVEPGRVDRLSPLIRRVVAANPGKFTFTGTGTYLVGRGSVAVIDPGPDLPAHLDAVLGALDPGEHVASIVVTHTHADHSGGVPALQDRTGAPTYGFGPHGPVAGDDPDDRVVFGDPEADGPETLPNPDADAHREGVDTTFVPDHRLADGEIVAGDGWTLEAVHTPGHTSNHLCFALAEEGVLFTGDHVMGWSTSVISPPDGDLVAFMASLQRLLDRRDAVYWPTHGPAVTAPRALVSAYLDHRRQRSAQILQALGDGPATIAELVPRIYTDVAKTLWKPAAASMYAHLLALSDDGRIVTDGERRRTSRYRLA